jgi:hypothetical protein
MGDLPLDNGVQKYNVLYFGTLRLVVIDHIITFKHFLDLTWLPDIQLTK